jgi:hypothetical protein
VALDLLYIEYLGFKYSKTNESFSKVREREYMSISVTQIINIATSCLSVTGRSPCTKSPGTECSVVCIIIAAIL